jgi:hypothetical protein
MSRLLDDARGILESAGYATYAARPDDPSIHFEDDCLLGFVRVFDDTRQLLERWRPEQETFLRRNSPSLVRDPVKAWNLYAVLLSRAPASAEDAKALFAIEEDFQNTRKIARGGIRTREELAIVLGPLLPIQTTLSLLPTDAHARLQDRLGSDKSLARLLLADSSLDDIDRWLKELP